MTQVHPQPQQVHRRADTLPTWIHRICGGGNSSTGNATTVDTICNSHFCQQHCTYLFPMLGWFASSALLSAYNKFVFGDNGTIQFPCPLFLTSLHFGAQWAFSVAVCAAFPETTGLARCKDLGWKEWASVSIPCGVVTAADVGLSNLSMVTISLTFYTMVKASTPVFVLFWAWLFQLERITWPLLGVIFVIACGEFLTVVGEVDFMWKGFIQCTVASVLSGARWTLVQLKLQSLDPPIKTSLATMRVLAPSMFPSLLIVALAIEEPWKHLVVSQVPYILFLGAIGATFAIGMVLCEFMLILQASAIVLMIGGVVKELLNIGIGMAFFGDVLNLINTLGFVIVFGGVILYKLTFHGSHATSERAPVAGDPERYGPVARSESELRPKNSHDSNEAFIALSDSLVEAEGVVVVNGLNTSPLHAHKKTTTSTGGVRYQIAPQHSNTADLDGTNEHGPREADDDGEHAAKIKSHGRDMDPEAKDGLMKVDNVVSEDTGMDLDVEEQDGILVMRNPELGEGDGLMRQNPQQR